MELLCVGELRTAAFVFFFAGPALACRLLSVKDINYKADNTVCLFWVLHIHNLCFDATVQYSHLY